MSKKNWLIDIVLAAVLVGGVTMLRAMETISANGGIVTVALPDDVKLELVKVEAGTFMMGSPQSEEGRFVNEAQHQVTLKLDFYIGKTEVTQAQWRAVMGNNPSTWKGYNRPVEMVSWDKAMAFCKKLNEMGLAPRGWKFILPTEAQWEYAARGGKCSRGFIYTGSNNVREIAWCLENYTHPVAQLKPNELGLYDMSGNVKEWCLDWYKRNYAADPEFLTGNSGSSRVNRGGGWCDTARSYRSASRNSCAPDFRNSDLGFRIALVQDK